MIWTTGRILLICFWVAISLGARAADAPPIMLTIAAEQGDVKAGDTIYIDLTYTNRTKQTILLYIESETVDDEGLDHPIVADYADKISVKDAAGRPVELTKYGRKFYEGPSGMSGPPPLEPGKPKINKVNLSGLYRMNIPGKYMVSVTRLLPPSIGGGAIESNQITITVTP